MAQEDAIGWMDWPRMEALAHLIRYDARGHGRSATTPHTEDYCWPQMAHNMWQIADFYGVYHSFLGGASMGCATALHAASQQPDRVRGLLLVIPPTAWEERRVIARNYRRAASFLSLSAGIPLKLLRWLPLPAGNGNFMRTMRRESVRLLATANHKGMVAALRGAALSDLPAPHQLQQLTMPALILAWKDDPVHPLSTAQLLAASLPNAELIIAKNANDPWHWGTELRRFVQTHGGDNQGKSNSI
jgi:pimeloyl-ACP methyl ester carboxylesterase